MIPYNPLAGGMLTGKHERDEPPTEGTRFTLGQRRATVPGPLLARARCSTPSTQLRPIAAEAGMTLATLAVAWVLAHPAITSPIIGASRPEQLDDTLAAADYAARRRPRRPASTSSRRSTGRETQPDELHRRHPVVGLVARRPLARRQGRDDRRRRTRDRRGHDRASSRPRARPLPSSTSKPTGPRRWRRRSPTRAPRAIPIVADLRDEAAAARRDRHDGGRARRHRRARQRRRRDAPVRHVAAPAALDHGGMGRHRPPQPPLRVLALPGAIPHMEARGGGSIVSVTSISGVFGSPNHSAYGAAKAGLIHLTKTLAVECGRSGIQRERRCRRARSSHRQPCRRCRPSAWRR